MPRSLILDSNKTVTNWISTVISPVKIKSFDTNLEPTMSDLANGRIILKFNHSVLVQKRSSSLYSNFISTLYIVYELNNWPCIPTNSFPLKNCLFGTVKSVRNTIKNKFNYNGRGIAFYGVGSWGFGNHFTGNVLGKRTTDAINVRTGVAQKKFVLILVKEMQNFG